MGLGYNLNTLDACHNPQLIYIECLNCCTEITKNAFLESQVAIGGADGSVSILDIVTDSIVARLQNFKGDVQSLVWDCLPAAPRSDANFNISSSSSGTTVLHSYLEF